MIEGMKSTVINVVLTFVLAIIFLYPSTSRAALINASGVLGQGGNFTTNTVNYPAGAVNPLGFGGLTSVALDAVNHRLFVSDNINNRILVFPLDSNNNIATNTPSYVFGACDFNSVGSSATTSSTFNGGSQYNYVNLAYDPAYQRLFVSIFAQDRVLAFDAAPATLASAGNCESALFVLGSTDFNSASGTTPYNFFVPDDMAYDSTNGRLFVADDSGTSGRVMVFSVPGNATSSINGENAIFELGQLSFTSVRTSGLNNRTLHLPTGVAYDSVNSLLYVSDYSKNRVMVFSVPANATSSINYEPAVFELGQADFTHSVATTTQNGLNGPDDLNYDSTNSRLFVADQKNNRIMVFSIPPNASTTFNGMNATNDIGQLDWTSNATGTAQNLFSIPESAATAYDVTKNTLYSYELYGVRVLELPMIHITTTSLPDATASNTYSQSINTTAAQGSSQSFSVYSGSLPVGLSLNSTTGIISGIPTSTGVSSFTIEVDDNFSTGPLFDRMTYSLTTGAAPVVPPTDNTPPVTNTTYSGGSLPLSVFAKLLSPSTTTDAYLKSRGFSTVSPNATDTLPVNNQYFSQNLRWGSLGSDVKSLQIYLNSHGFIISSSGAGSLGNETDTFGSLTKIALIKFQKAHDIPATGYFGPMTRSFINSH